jgi:SH3-like domain-containing protein
MKQRLLMLMLLSLPLASGYLPSAAAAPKEDTVRTDEESADVPDEESATPAETATAVAVKGKFPRYASVKKTEVNVRSGPGNQYPILWIYQRAGYPVQLLARYDNYYKVRDAEGEEGWVYITMISAQKTALVGGHDGNATQPTPLYKKDDANGGVLAKLAPGLTVLLKDDTCGERCYVEAGGYKGYVTKKDLLMVE